jgi:hypothetical protein
MRATTKRILSELQGLDRGDAITLFLEPAIYPSAVVEEVRRSLNVTAGVCAPEQHMWEVPAKEVDAVLDALLILTVRGLM